MTTAPTTLRGRLRRLLGRATDDGAVGRTVSAPRALEMVRDGAVVLDVRERAEWKTGHAPHAVHVPLGDIAKAPGRLGKDRPVVVMCASGMRSRTAAKHLRDAGLTATSLSGGIGAWQAAGGAVRR
ncbi:rhodanese-like domain-containing protein [Cellulomonas bogoriensis]|uniref:Thiosulfate sulfurtransferase n=1 Tax=Cellulomonas bogoriensis 69B4 = DSM 16987 TaxID=1386082 RepID=A0A0A0C0N9_9CELL|nr:rhodanese-like domain-containing protein [Cellulomonas bogoriensis]KGM14208.1 thiosulfate sulfurtransferase [Cellulomonas bogoriensis 69B4 = DSM 16987]